MAELFQPPHHLRESPAKEHDSRRQQEIAPRILERGRHVMEPRQVYQRLVQPNLRAVVVEELRDVELYDEDEPNQPREETKSNAARARAGPGDYPQHRMTHARRLDLEQFQA